MNKKDLFVHVLRLDGTKELLKPRSVIDAICNDDGSIKFAYNLFDCPPDCVSMGAIVDRRDRDKMLATSGEFTLVETPASPAVLYWTSIILSVASAIYAFTVARNIPDVGDLGESANNSLSARTNKERPNQRIEDIAGEVQSVPTLIQLPYRKWVDGVEVEYSYMCVSVGSGVPIDARDGNTPIEFMDGSGAQFYAPNTSPNNTLTPEYTFGQSFQENIEIIRRSNEVDGGRVLDTISDFTLFFNDSDNEAQTATGAQAGRLDRRIGRTFEYSDFFDVNDLVTLTIDVDDGVGGNVDLDGDYKVSAVGTDYIELLAPDGSGAETVNANWGTIPANAINSGKGDIAPTDSEVNYTQPFFLADEPNGFYVNFAANGLIRDNGGSITINIGIQYAEADSDGNQTGAWSTEAVQTISGQTRNKVGATYQPLPLLYKTNLLVRFRRITDRIENAQLQDITLDALYARSTLAEIDFGNVTTVQTRILQSQRASQVKQRKFNSIWQRKLPIVQTDGTLGAEAVTKRFVDYFAYAALSDRIGRREQWEVNNADLLATYNDIVAHFGSSAAGEFNFTFDKDQTSFQDTADIIAKAVFCEPVRKLGVITFKFEKPQAPRTIFSHRTKIPNQQTITRSFANDAINDGVELTYTDPDTNEQATLFVPDQTAIRPRKITAQGVRNYSQAYWLAWRAYNKLRYQKITLNDTFTAEGQLLSVLDCAGVTDDTKVMPQGGEVVAVDGLTLTLSQPAQFSTGTHSITLRKRDGTIEGIACTNASGVNPSLTVTLAAAPAETIYTDDAEQRTVFTFAPDSLATADIYLFGNVDRSDSQAVSVEAVNYDARYYQNDTDDPLV